MFSLTYVFTDAERNLEEGDVGRTMSKPIFS